MTYTFPIAASFSNPTLRREIDRFFVDTIHGPSAPQWQPNVTAREDGKGYTFEADIPGVDPASVEVLTEGGVLTLRGTRAARGLEEGAQVRLAETPYGTFVRRFVLPKEADLQAVEATYAFGVLAIRVAKLVPAQPRRVPVTVTSLAEHPSNA